MKKRGFAIILFLIVFVFSFNISAKNSFTGEKEYVLKYQMPKGTIFTMSSTGTTDSISDQMGTEVVVYIVGDGKDTYEVLSADKEKGLTIQVEFKERTQDVDSPQGAASTDFSELIGKKSWMNNSISIEVNTSLRRFL